MTITVNLPEKLHQALPTDCSASGIVRQMLEAAVGNPSVLAEAFTLRAEFYVHQEGVQRYTIYLPKEEQERADKLAARYLLSRNQLIQILLESIMFRAGHWPPVH